MRKYQQLCLLLISVCSLIVLFMYKSENNRLKYVLQVVNFFGRNDASTMVLQRIENSTTDDALDFITKPLPLWQVIGDNFYAYSSYWFHNDLMAGGESITLIAGNCAAVINFSCSLVYDKGIRRKGKFRFQPLSDENKQGSFRTYKFFCHHSQQLDSYPHSVVFADIAAPIKMEFKLRLRIIDRSFVATQKSTTMCVDIVNDDLDAVDANEEMVLQFFAHHHALGVKYFIVYNGEGIVRQVQQILSQIRLYVLPFNFPFMTTNTTELLLRAVIEADCILRNSNFVRYTMLLKLNELLYPYAKLHSEQSVFRSINHYDADITHFELPSFSVCIDHKYKMLIDNNQYDPEKRAKYRIFIYKLSHKSALVEHNFRSVALPLSMVFVHCYNDCIHVGSDGLHDWRNSIRKDFMQFISSVRSEVIAIMKFA